MIRLACITARGGSKRIPRKNIREFYGKPIIAYSIETAVKSGCFDEVMVSTDDEEIAEVAKQYGASVPFMRSAKSSDDFANTSDVLKEVVCEYRKMGIDINIICGIYPTAVFLDEETLKKAVEIYESNSDIHGVIPVTRFPYPPQRGLIIKDGMIKMREPSYKLLRSQDIEKMYHDAGQFYFMNCESFMESGDLWAGNICPLELPEMSVQDIDTLEDWKLAEFKYQYMKERKNGENGN